MVSNDHQFKLVTSFDLKSEIAKMLYEKSIGLWLVNQLDCYDEYNETISYACCLKEGGFWGTLLVGVGIISLKLFDFCYKQRQFYCNLRELNYILENKDIEDLQKILAEQKLQLKKKKKNCLAYFF